MRALALFAGLALVGAVLITLVSFSSAPTPAPAAGPPRRETLQERLRRLPGDHRGWAELAIRHIDQARLTGDPSAYTKAEGALATAAKIAPKDDAVLTGQAALAAARHEFARAAELAGSAIAANPYAAAAYGVLADARTQLGDLRAAQQAVDTMMALRPGVAAFTRASYAAELRGDVETARTYLDYAHEDAWLPADRAYARYYQGELALHEGDVETAARHYADALNTYPAYTPALAGQAKVAALDGRLTEALSLYDQVVQRLPLPQYLIEQGEIRIKAGLPADWTLLEAQRKLYEAAGVRDDLTWAEFEADHGDPKAAVRHARAEYTRNPNLVAADALAWSLFKAGAPEKALPYAERATGTGWKNPLHTYHRTRIERSLGLTKTSYAHPGRGFDPDLPALARFS
ncbi:hypothetical protein ABZW11_24920 [Nonomuraea sp. NPDC004580]|uniref:tetratricopeptide repeat protein n=1 Tax=Nonomuraea sp. NPDC004580 TaxID=3154552 RepID=UPI0033B2A83C